MFTDMQGFFKLGLLPDGQLRIRADETMPYEDMFRLLGHVMGSYENIIDLLEELIKERNEGGPDPDRYYDERE